MMKMAQITTTEFAAELGTDSRTARKFLRSITPKDEQPGKGSRWAIEGNKRSLGQMKKRFADWTAAQAKPAEDEVTETEDQVEEPTAEELDELEVEEA
jgi:hypothetical protein